MTSQALRSAKRHARRVGPVAMAVIVQGVGNLAFHAVVGRLLDADAYGALGAVLAAMVMLSVPLGALQTAASALVVTHGLNWGTARQTLIRVALATMLPAVVVLACSPWLRDYFRLDSWTEAALLAPYLVVTAVLAAVRGLLLGYRQTRAVAVSYLIGVLVRLAVGLGLVLPFGVTGALLGTLAGEVAALAIAFSLLSPSADASVTGWLRLRAVGRAAIAVTGLFLFSTVDLFLARHHLRDGASGAYVAAATVAKTVLAVPAGIMAVVFPSLLAAWPGRGRGRALLVGAAGCGMREVTPVQNQDAHGGSPRHGGGGAVP